MIKPVAKNLSNGGVSIDARGYQYAEFVPEKDGFTIRLTNTLTTGVSSLIRRDNKVFIPGSVRNIYGLGKDSKVVVAKKVTSDGNEYFVKTPNVFDTTPVITSRVLSSTSAGDIGFSPVSFAVGFKHIFPVSSEYAKISMFTNNRLVMLVSDADEEDMSKLTSFETAEAEFGRGARYCPQPNMTVVKKVGKGIKAPDWFKASVAHYYKFAFGNCSQNEYVCTPVVSDNKNEFTLENGMHDTYSYISTMHSQAYVSAVMANRAMNDRCAAYAAVLKNHVNEQETNKAQKTSADIKKEELLRILRAKCSGSFEVNPEKLEA